MAVEGRIARPEGPAGRVEHLDHLALESDQRVVAHLILIAGVGGDEGVDRRGQPVDRLVQDDQPRGWIDRLAEGVLVEALTVVGGIGVQVEGALRKHGTQPLQALLQGRVGAAALAVQGTAPGLDRRGAGARRGTPSVVAEPWTPSRRKLSRLESRRSEVRSPMAAASQPNPSSVTIPPAPIASTRGWRATSWPRAVAPGASTSDHLRVWPLGLRLQSQPTPAPRLGPGRRLWSDAELPALDRGR